jgi:hypothetical protein
MDSPSDSLPPPTKYSDKLEPDTPQDGYHGVPKDWKFWCIIFSLAVSILMTAVEFVSCHRHSLHPLATGSEGRRHWQSNNMHHAVDRDRGSAPDHHP